jgi:hypothetical protein
VIERTPSPTPATLHFSQVAKNKSATFNGRCVIIINPIALGYGDKSLAVKLSRIIQLQNIKVEILPINIGVFENSPSSSEDITQICTDIISENNELLASVAMTSNNVSLVVAPANLLFYNEREILINLIQTTYNYKKKTPVLINEMGTLLPKCYSLGFNEKELGYLPTSNKTVTHIAKNYKINVDNLIDSFQLTFNPNHLYFLGYLSSFIEPIINALCMILFIQNTQAEHGADHSVSHYVLSYTDFTKDIIQEVEQKLGLFKLNYTFNLYQYNENNIKLIASFNTDKQYSRIINIYCGGMMPQEIFFSFIKASKDGMMTGDHSLSEYISLTGSFPYYQKHSFKELMVKSILDIAEQIGGDCLKHYISTKIIGFNKYETRLDFKRLYKPLLDEIAQTDVKQKFEQAIAAKNAEPLLIKIFNNLVASV